MDGVNQWQDELISDYRRINVDNSIGCRFLVGWLFKWIRNSLVLINNKRFPCALFSNHKDEWNTHSAVTFGMEYRSSIKIYWIKPLMRVIHDHQNYRLYKWFDHDSQTVAIHNHKAMSVEYLAHWKSEGFDDNQRFLDWFLAW